MANIKSAKKRVLIAEANRVRNVAFKSSIKTAVKKALEFGLIVISAGSDVIRLVPPLVIEKEHIDEMITKLEKAIQALQA